ncbi:UDP-D-apiose/UDP-D-xylose synthase 2 [Orobanche minor]
MTTGRVNLDGNPIKSMTICMIGAGGFIGSHLCEKLLEETPHKVLAVDVGDDKIKQLIELKSQWGDRIQFHRLIMKSDSLLEGLIRMADLTINIGLRRTSADYTLDTICSNFFDALPVVKCCSENNKRLIHFSTSEIYGKPIGAFLPKDSPLRQDPSYFLLKEDESPCIFGPVEKQRWSNTCAKLLIERLIYAEGADGLEFTIVRPFNWIGPRMNFVPGINGPNEGVPRVIACFSDNLLKREPLKLVDGGQSQRTFVCIEDATEAVLLMIENPDRANGHIFNVGNPNNEVTVKKLAEMMTQIYAKVSGEAALDTSTVDVSSKDFYGEEYDDTDKRIPDMTIINRQLGWDPKTSLSDLLESTLAYQHKVYAEANKTATSKPGIKYAYIPAKVTRVYSCKEGQLKKIIIMPNLITNINLVRGIARTADKFFSGTHAPINVKELFDSLHRVCCFHGRVKRMAVLSQTKEYQDGHFFVEFAEHADAMEFYEYTEKIDLFGDVAVKRLFPNLNKTSFDVCASKRADFLPHLKAPDKDSDVTQVLQVVYGDLKRNMSSISFVDGDYDSTICHGKHMVITTREQMSEYEEELGLYV